MVLIYVDDIIVIGSSLEHIAKFISHLSQVFNMRVLGNLHYFLGIQVSREFSTLTLTQTHYVLISLLHKFGLEGAKPVTTPLPSSVHLSTNDDIPPSDPTFYRKLVASLQYLTLTRYCFYCQSRLSIYAQPP